MRADSPPIFVSATPPLHPHMHTRTCPHSRPFPFMLSNTRVPSTLRLCLRPQIQDILEELREAADSLQRQQDAPKAEANSEAA